jgi:hypothetical protein
MQRSLPFLLLVFVLQAVAPADHYYAVRNISSLARLPLALKPSAAKLLLLSLLVCS